MTKDNECYGYKHFSGIKGSCKDCDDDKIAWEKYQESERLYHDQYNAQQLEKLIEKRTRLSCICSACLSNEPKPQCIKEANDGSIRTTVSE